SRTAWQPGGQVDVHARTLDGNPDHRPAVAAATDGTERPSAREMGRAYVDTAVKTPSTSPILSPASRTALRTASTWRVSWLLLGSVPSSSLSSTPTMQTELRSSFIAHLPRAGRGAG